MKINLRFYFILINLLFIGIESWSQSIRINELMAVNTKTKADSNGEYSDWIELYNGSNATINLKGWSITDNPDDARKWIFPNIEVSAKKYLLVFASGNDTVLAGGELHCNFKLSGDGEYLAIYTADVKLVSEISPAYPAMNDDESFGWMDNSWVKFTIPTPGDENYGISGVELPAPAFSQQHGFYTQAFELSINNLYGNSDVYYTTDGSEPTINDKKYNAPITISGTTIIRAKAIVKNWAGSKTSTQTYLFVDDIIHQSNTPEGYPSQWGKYVALPGNAIADYEMDPELTNDPIMAQRTKEALYALPVISLVSDKDNFFSQTEDPETGGIYVFTAPPGNEIGLGWERPVSMEYFEAKSTSSFQIDCGIQLHGGHSRRPEKAPKHSFRISFKSEYGQSKLEFPLFKDTPVSKFNSIILRAGFGNSWTHWASDERERAQYGRDTWAKDTQREMGHLSSHSIYVHLFINGIYWGIYNPGERLDNDFAATYMGGDPEDYDIIKDYTEVPSGNDEAWKKLISLANKGVKEDSLYQFIQGKNADGSKNWDIESYVDVENLMDYMLMNFYGGNTDWDHHNWAVIRNRINPGNGFRFYAWDEEHVLKSQTENTTGEFNSGCPSNIFQQLAKNELFKRTFANRVLTYCTNNGILTTNSNRERWMKRSVVIENAIDAESARWGDYRRDVHPYQTGQKFDLYTKDKYWIPARDLLMQSYFPKRTEILLDQLRNAGLFPTVNAPDFALNGNNFYESDINMGDELEMIYDQGLVYYSLDGSDPVNWEQEKGEVAPTALHYVSKIQLKQSAQVNARCFYKNAWSAMRTAFFRIKTDYHAIKITEIHYHPAPALDNSDNYEFIELKNTGNATLNLKGLKFIEGIKYEFTEDKALSPGQFIVLASNEKFFYQRYQKAAYAAYEGNLSNGGEELMLTNYAGDTICIVHYRDNKGWPEDADGTGPSIVPVEINPQNNQNNPEEWRASFYDGGSPFNDDMDSSDDIVQLGLASLGCQLKCFPNPFSNETVIEYQLSSGSGVEIAVYNAMGEKVSTLINSHQPTGTHRIRWNGKGMSGQQLPVGLYICRIQVETGLSSFIEPVRLMKIN